MSAYLLKLNSNWKESVPSTGVTRVSGGHLPRSPSSMMPSVWNSAFGDAPDILSVFTVSFLSCKYFCGPQIKVLRQLPLTFQRRKPPRGSIRNVPCRQFQRGGKPEGVKGKREEMMIIWDLPSPPVFLRPGPLLGPCPPLYPHLPWCSPWPFGFSETHHPLSCLRSSTVATPGIFFPKTVSSLVDLVMSVSGPVSLPLKGLPWSPASSLPCLPQSLYCFILGYFLSSTYTLWSDFVCLLDYLFISCLPSLNLVLWWGFCVLLWDLV